MKFDMSATSASDSDWMKIPRAEDAEWIVADTDGLKDILGMAEHPLLIWLDTDTSASTIPTAKIPTEQS